MVPSSASTFSSTSSTNFTEATCHMHVQLPVPPPHRCHLSRIWPSAALKAGIGVSETGCMLHKLVAVHGDVHAAAARRRSLASQALQRLQVLLQLLHKLHGGSAFF